MSSMYSEKVMEHFRNPRNVGEIEDADGIGEVGNAACGDIMKIYLKVKDDIIEDVKFQTFGCASAIASSPAAAIFSTNSERRSARRATRTTRQPSRASAVAVAAPIPLEAPVTTAIG